MINPLFNDKLEMLDDDVLIELGNMYCDGTGVEKNFEMAIKCYGQAAKRGNSTALCCIGDFYFNGLDVKYDYEKAFEYYKMASLKDNEVARYHIIWDEYRNNDEINYKELFDLSVDFHVCDNYFYKIKRRIDSGSKVISMDSLVDSAFKKGYGNSKDLSKIIKLIFEYLNQLPDDTIINLKSAKMYEYVCLEFYTLSDMKKIVKACYKILKDIDLNQSQEDIFMQIYIKLGMFMHYDEKAQCDKKSTSGNLMVLLNKKGLCVGYAYALNFLLDMVGIDSIILGSRVDNENVSHVYNQVKINGNWYYCDLTIDSDMIKMKKVPPFCLNSRSNFQNSLHHQTKKYFCEYDTHKNFIDVKSLFIKNYLKLFNKKSNLFLGHLIKPNEINDDRGKIR